MRNAKKNETVLQAVDTKAGGVSPFVVLRHKLEGTLLGRTFLRILGVVAIGVLTGIYFQVVPLLLVLLGGYMGINRLELTVDAVIYALSGLAIVAPMVYFYSKGVLYLWGRLVFARHPSLSFSTHHRETEHS